MKECYKGIVIADFNAGNLVGGLANDKTIPRIEMATPVYGQVAQSIQGVADTPADNQDFAVVWTQPQAVISTFARTLQGERVSVEQLLAEVDTYVQLLAHLRERVATVLVPSWTLNSERNLFALTSLQEGIGLDNLLMRMNLRLAEALDKLPGFYLLNAQTWLTRAGQEAFNPKLWYLSKTPFGAPVFKEAVQTIKSALRGIAGQSRKLVVLDLDNTLWGGIVGDDGWQNLRLGGHDAVGEAFVDFQRELKALSRRGIVLAVVSKNEEEVALEAMHNHPEMVLKPEDLVGWRINWQDKAANIADLVSDLNLGLESVVFIDDNPVERARVQEALPDVTVPDWPEDVTRYPSALLELACINPPSLTDEDLQRTQMYVSELKRSGSREGIQSIDEWLSSLQTRVTCETLNSQNFARVCQLLNKTNQMNLSTRRLSEAELQAWSAAENHKLWAFRVADKFGDLGIVGIVSIEITGYDAQIVDFVLSCRAMGRKIEETMLSVVVDYALDQGLQRIQARLLPTEKNKPCLAFWQRSGFGSEDDLTFQWHADSGYPCPEQVALDVNP